MKRKAPAKQTAVVNKRKGSVKCAKQPPEEIHESAIRWATLDEALALHGYTSIEDVKRKDYARTTVVYEREGSLERVIHRPHLRPLQRHQDIHESAINSLEDFQRKAKAAAAKLETRGLLSRDLARRLRWLTKRLQKSLDAGTPRWDLYMALGAGLEYGAAVLELRGLAPPENRSHKFALEDYHAVVRKLESSGEKPTNTRIARALHLRTGEEVTAEGVRKWRKKHLAHEERTASAKR